MMPAMAGDDKARGLARLIDVYGARVRRTAALGGGPTYIVEFPDRTITLSPSLISDPDALASLLAAQGIRP